MSDEATDALIAWKKEVQSNKNNKVKESQYIFCDKEGDFMKESGLRSLIARFKKKYELQDTGIHLYKFRHTMCTRLILANVPLPIIQRIMGDNTQYVILRIYTHIYRADVRTATMKFFEEPNRKYHTRRSGT